VNREVRRVDIGRMVGWMLLFAIAALFYFVVYPWLSG
jgi:hypothetical protein